METPKTDNTLENISEQEIIRTLTLIGLERQQDMDMRGDLEPSSRDDIFNNLQPEQLSAIDTPASSIEEHLIALETLAQANREAVDNYLN